MTFRCLRCQSELDPAFKACPHCGEPVTDFVRRYATEPLDGKYRLISRLGTGGMGEVYKVEHTFLGALRVVKVIRAQISGDEGVGERFLREARLATKVQHPNVATLHDFSALPDGAHYMVWEYIDGENVAELLHTRAVLPPRQAARIAIEALLGLEAIHRAGIVHRDISPENIMLTREHGQQRVKVIDLGVARSDEGEANVTRTGMFVGKIRYASPEHVGFLADGERMDGRADLYSLAIVLYEMLTGRPPYEATTPHQYVAQLSRDTPMRALDLDNVPGGPQLEAVLRKALDRDRAKRYTTAGEFAEALEAIERTLPDPVATPTVDIRFDPEATRRVTSKVAEIGLETIARPSMARQAAQSPQPVVNPTEPAVRRHASPQPSVPQPAARQQLPRPPAVPTLIEKRRSLMPLVAVIGVVLSVVAAALFLARTDLFTKTDASASQQQQLAPSAQKHSQTAALTGSQSPATGSVDVVAAPVTNTVATVPTATLSTATKAVPEPVRPATAVAAAPPPAVVVEPPVASSHAASYRENGDSDANDRALAQAQAALPHVSRVAVVADQDQLKDIMDAITSRVSDVKIVSRSERPEAVIEFHGKVEPMGRGRKRRSGSATVSANGRSVFHYEMPPEDYRVGDTPAEAFARVLSTVLRP